MIHTHVAADYETLSQQAAAWLLERLRARPEALICLASGGTPRRMYELLAERGPKEPATFAGCRVIKLDEWGGLAADDPATCEQHLQKAIVEPLGLGPRYTGFASEPRDPEAECARIANWVNDHGPLDMCVLGLGVNGHLGFNEPAEFLRPHAHVARLSQASLLHAMLACGKRRPKFGLTLGMSDIFQSREILVVVSGASKREPLRRLMAAEITTQFPATLLHLHPHVTLICDRAARQGDRD